MSLDVGELVGYLRLDTKKAKKDIADGESAMVGQASKSGDKAGHAAGKSFGGALGKAVKTAVGFAAGFAVFKGVTQFLGDSISAASDLNETVSKGRNIFGGAARGVEDWAKKSDRALGLSQQAALAATSQFGDMFTQLGQGQQQAANTSERIVKLAADLGSFHNLDTQDVLDRIAGGFRGEYDSLQLLIPNISAARVQQEALTETGKKNANQLTANEKAMATLAIVTKDSKNATGDFARTSGGLANQQKILSAQVDNLKAKVGSGLYPVVTALVVFGNTKFLPFLSALGGGLVSVWHAMGPVVGAGGQLVNVFQALPPPIQGTLVALIALTALRPRLLSFGSTLGDKVGGGAKTASSGLETLRLHGMYMADAFKSAETRTRGLGSAMGYGAKAGLRGAAGGLVGLLGGPWGIALTGATVALGFLIAKHQQAKARVNDLTQAIEADNGALGENTRATLANAIQKTDAVKLAKSLGVSLTDLTDSLLGQADATTRVKSALDQYLPQLGVRPVTALSAKADALNQILQDQAGDLGKAGQAARDHAALMGQSATSTDTAATAQGALGTSTTSTTGAVKDQTAAVKTWIQKVDDATGQTLDLRSANRDVKQAIADAEQALKDNGKTLSINSQKGRDNQAAIDAMVQAVQARADAQKAARVPDQQVHDDLVAQRDVLIDVAAKFLGSKKKAQEYIDKLLKIPPVVSTKISLTAYDANRALGVLIGQANKLHGLLGDLPTPGFGNTKNSAIGNILHFAGGGENHTAQIGNGTTRIWNEPETGGEAYIPLAGGGKRARAVSITADVANRFGYQLTPKGAGMGGGNIGSLVTIQGDYVADHGPDDAAMALRFAMRGAGVGA